MVELVWRWLKWLDSVRIYERTDVRCEMEQLRNSLAFHRSKIADKEDKTKRLVTFLSIPYKTAEQGIFGFFFS